MRLTLLIHILGGTLALVAGYIALYSAKGARLHRRSGRVFVYAMLTLSLTGATIAALGAGEASVVAGLLAAYLVITGLITVKPVFGRSRWLNLGLMVGAMGLGLASLGWGVETLAAGKRDMDGVPVQMFFVFGTVALLSGVSDARMIRAGGLKGVSRLARHLWRMCFALWIAAASFFLGQADELPKALRIPPLLAVPVLVVLVTMFYWLWRVRVRRSVRGIRVTAPEAV